MTAAAFLVTKNFGFSLAQVSVQVEAFSKRPQQFSEGSEATITSASRPWNLKLIFQVEKEPHCIEITDLGMR